jgi:glycosyltransferase involved in cell wall biosynthesis
VGTEVIENVTAGGVYWNEAHRLPRLLALLQEHFARTVVVVQESDDDTLGICQRMARQHDRVRTDEHRGAGDPSFPIMVQTVETPWIFVVSGDEWPTTELLDSLPDAVRMAEQRGHDGVSIQFQARIDGIETHQEQDRHVRLFATRVGWPHAMLHSRPLVLNPLAWETGYIQHDRTLDEMIRDYLRYWNMGRLSDSWSRHNGRMIHDACELVAAHKGWPYITLFPWWPEVRSIAFGGSDPQ